MKRAHWQTICLAVIAIAFIIVIVIIITLSSQVSTIRLVQEVRETEQVGFVYAIKPHDLDKEEQHFIISVSAYKNGECLYNKDIKWGETQTFGDSYFIGFTGERIDDEIALRIRGAVYPSGIKYSEDVYSKIRMISLVDKSGLQHETPMPLALIVYDKNVNEIKVDEYKVDYDSLEGLSTQAALILVVSIRFED